ncbi:hypothetical protein [Actinomadura rudentiformis]|uniref:LppX_LprAFG lipoprotein n=1 Tax=Actinomadura rudentiformis TaxID=359158 RepID=A0A6H9YI75_9ACTN|nr:hypothetical protein [Actinomadura rudentiformis]KAB2340611.1 hypothetical protein F8566_44635 [Actinomadura rudentiformis]
MPKHSGATRARLYVAVGALALPLAVGACDAGSTGKTAPTVTVTATPPQTAAQIATKAQGAFTKAPNVRVRGKVKTEKGRITLDYSVRGKNSKGKISGPLTSKKSTTTQFVIIGDKHYTRGSEVIVGDGPKPPASLLKKLKNQWTVMRGKDMGVLGSFATNTMIFGPAGTGETLSLGPGRDFEGKPAFDLTDGEGTHLWISSQGEPLPLAVTNDKSPADRLVFAYGQAERITAPANAVDFSKQGFQLP